MLQEHVEKFETWDTSFKELVAIVASAREDYEGGYLFNLKSLELIRKLC
jgi:hypothetical protein